MIEVLYLLILPEFAPTTRVNITANALDIKDTFCGDECICIEADIVNMVIPGRMFAKRCNDHFFRRFVLPLWIESFDNFLYGGVQHLASLYYGQSLAIGTAIFSSSVQPGSL